MNTHTVILKCEGGVIPDDSHLECFVASKIDGSKVECFSRNGRRLYSNPQGIMENLRGKIFIRVSFKHLLKLDSSHAFAIVRQAVKMGMARVIKRDGDGLEVILP